MSILRKNSPGLPWLIIRTLTRRCSQLGCSESAYRNECYFVSQPHPLPELGRGVRWMQARAAAGLLRLETGDVSSPVSEDCSGNIGRVLGRHPDGVISVVHGSGRVITPSGDSSPTELWITRETILWLVTFARDVNRAHRRAFEADKGSGREVVWPGERKHNGAIVICIKGDGWIH